MRFLFACMWGVIAVGAAMQSAAQPVDAGGILVRVEGHVRVNEGAKYQSAHPGMAIPINARVLVLNKAKAVVRHADGCLTQLAANTLFVLDRRSPCQGGVAVMRMIKPVDVAMPQSAGVAASGGILGGGLTIPVAVGVGALVVGGTVAGAVVGTSGGGGPSRQELQFFLKRKLSPD